MSGFTVGIIFCLCKLLLANCRPESEAIPIGRNSTSKNSNICFILYAATHCTLVCSEKCNTVADFVLEVDTATAFLSGTGDIMPASLPLSLPASSASQSVVEPEQEEVRKTKRDECGWWPPPLSNYRLHLLSCSSPPPSLTGEADGTDAALPRAFLPGHDVPDVPQAARAHHLARGLVIARRPSGAHELVLEVAAGGAPLL